MGLFSKLRERLASLTRAPQTIAQRAAPRIEAKLRADARTRRGNVPSFSPGGPNVPIEVRAQGNEITVTAVDWVLRKANEKGQTTEWAGIVRDEARRA